MQQQRIRLLPSLDQLDNMKRYIHHYCIKHNISDSVRPGLELVCEEWFINIVVHGFQDKATDHPILLQMNINDKRELVLQFTDRAPAFNPLDHQSPALDLPAESRPIGGLGIHLIKAKTDRCEYQRIDETNQFTMYIKLE